MGFQVMSVLNEKFFRDEKSAFKYLEAQLWADGVVCPHCGSTDRSGRLQGVKDRKGETRLGLWKCYECRKQFTCTVGTVFESRHIPLHKMLQAVYLMTSSKKGVSAHQLHRVLEVTYKTAWFLAHRIREAMRDGKLAPMGGAGSIVEADETYFGKTEEQPTHTTRGTPFKKRGSHGPAGKRGVLALVERGGPVRTFHIERADQATVAAIVRTNVSRESELSTDESKLYTALGKEFAKHHRVRHARKQYVKGDGHTNTLEGYFSIFKRGMKGVYQHCAEKHLHRYLAEFDFRYNNRVALGVNDRARADAALKGIVGKRVTYRWPDSLQSQEA
jgi:transposase-like protein